MKYLLFILPTNFKIWLLNLLYKDIAAMGDDGDTELAHVNAEEAKVFYLWVVPALLIKKQA